ncbi:MAG: glycosyl transferase [Phycisphaerae bacterium]|nr:MAG: glycosyl transferase [Phycisphaerae bacterium]
MRILHVEAGMHFYGGPRQVAYLIEGLAARGHECVLACPPGAAIGSKVSAHARVHATAIRGDLDVLAVRRLARVIRREKPDLVHAHSRRGADVWSGLAAKVGGVPCVLSRRVDNPESRLAMSTKYRLFDHVVAISEAIRRVMLSSGMAASRVTCVRSAVDASPYLRPVDRAAFEREFDLPSGSLVIGMVAQLIQRKGHHHLIEALGPLTREFPRLRVVIFGKGPLERAIRAAVQERRLEATVRFAGFRDDLPKWLGGLDVLAHPAEIEGLGVALLQAAAAGVPIVASRAGGMPEAVLEGVTGLLTEPGDAVQLAVALRTLLADESVRRRMGEAGRARILAEFTVDVMVEGNLRVYEQVLSWKRGASTTA